jgi:DNA polymerase III subunit beta
MDILIDPEKAGGLLALAASVAKEKSPLPALSGLSLSAEGGEVRAMATDAEASVTVRLPAQVREAGRLCVNAKALMEVIRRAEGRAAALKTGSSDKGRAECSLGQSRYQLGLLPSDEMPLIRMDARAGRVELAAEKLAALFEDVRSAAGSDANRYVLDSVLLERRGARLVAVATDGRRLAYRETALTVEGEDFSVPVPMGAVRAFLKAVPLVEDGAAAVFLHDGERVGFALDGVDIAARALEGEFPRWRDAIPADKDAVFAVVSADKLMGAVEGLIRVVSDPAEIVIERRDENRLAFSTAGRLNAGEEVLETNVPTRAFPAVKVNGRYLLDAAAPVKGRLIRIGVLKADRPVLMQSMDDQSYRAVVMPILGSKEESKASSLAGVGG